MCPCFATTDYDRGYGGIIVGEKITRTDAVLSGVERGCCKSMGRLHILKNIL